MINKVKVNTIKNNPGNPRLIKDDKFKKLVQSIKDFPEMLEIRPIVINKDNIILGGNMRFKACIEAGLKEVYVKKVDLTDDQEKEFIIKDNVSGGEWAWDIIANEWDAKELEDWGLDVQTVINSEEIDLSEDLKENFRIEILLKSEEDQEKLYNELIEKGYECRLLTL